MIHVCFVDDDALLLAGVKRTLKQAAPSISLALATSGVEALEVLHDQPFDVLISDLNMPGMDGLSLMHAVQSQFPEMARVIATGDIDPYRAFELQLVAHRVVSKPVDSAALVSLVQQLYDSRSVAIGECALPTRQPVQWAQRAARHLGAQQATSITVEIARGNPWLSVLLLQATNAGFVASSYALCVEAAVRALGQAHLDIMFKQLHAMRDNGSAGGQSATDAAHQTAMISELIALSRNIAIRMVSQFAEDTQYAHRSEAEHTNPTNTAAQEFFDVVESATLLRAASLVDGAPDSDAVLHIAMQAARLGVPAAIVAAVRASVCQPVCEAGTAGAALQLTFTRYNERHHQRNNETFGERLSEHPSEGHIEHSGEASGALTGAARDNA